MSVNTQITPEIISRLNNLSLKARMIVEGFIVGLHQSPFHGFSVEFAQHRSYTRGDEIRHIDWKLFAKTERYYIKEYEEETNLRSYILLDQSKSMEYKSGILTKLEYSKTLAASLSYLMLKQQDATGLMLFDKRLHTFIPPKSKKNQLNILLKVMNKIKPGEDTKIAPILHHCADIINKRGLIILISDLLDDPDKILSGLRHLRYNGHEIIVFHILDNQEINFDFKENVRFKDMETREEIVTQPWHIRQDYKTSFKKFSDYYKNNLLKHHIDYIQITTNNSLDTALSEYLIKRKKIK